MKRWLCVCWLAGCAALFGCGDGDVGAGGGPGFLEACDEEGGCGTGLACRTDDNTCIGANSITVSVDFPTELQHRFEPMSIGLLSLEDREVIAEAQIFDPSLVVLFTAVPAPTDFPTQIELAGVPPGDQWVVVTMDNFDNETSYGDNRFEMGTDGTLRSFDGEPVSRVDLVFYTDLPVGNID